LLCLAGLERRLMTKIFPFNRVVGLTLSLLVVLLMVECSRPVATQDPVRPEEQNRQIVLAFYTEALVNLHARSGFERYMSEDFIEHKPDIATGNREGTITFLEGVIKESPHPTWKIVRTIAEGDMVFLHASFTPADGAPPYALADVFRLRDGKIVEHWDVVAPPSKQSSNPNSRF
jgi:predicted SnoaL-like aldol condensation-catalyzing enzyme